MNHFPFLALSCFKQSLTFDATSPCPCETRFLTNPGMLPLTSPSDKQTTLIDFSSIFSAIYPAIIQSALTTPLISGTGQSQLLDTTQYLLPYRRYLSTNTKSLSETGPIPLKRMQLTLIDSQGLLTIVFKPLNSFICGSRIQQYSSVLSNSANSSSVPYTLFTTPLEATLDSIPVLYMRQGRSPLTLPFSSHQGLDSSLINFSRLLLARAVIASKFPSFQLYIKIC